MTLRFGQGWYTVFWPEDIPAYVMRMQGWGWSWAAGVQRLPVPSRLADTETHLSLSRLPSLRSCKPVAYC